ncbi:predicted protein [Streptomyces viridochromogenes DSM 40736]|uniref:Predicted protein n=1 Tax=Streptomyces viridochromogenes (strain DSM 40736 / JCM 4977 / BCRC 1201 / Tue 494) TaxID=591159 RepID=D9X8M1_STRVT|nr:predicted protein [Streptomyces viridochromogenes DSM 40736]
MSVPDDQRFEGVRHSGMFAEVHEATHRSFPRDAVPRGFRRAGLGAVDGPDRHRAPRNCVSAG